MNKGFVFIITLILFNLSASAQFFNNKIEPTAENVVKWQMNVSALGKDTFQVNAVAKVAPDYHVWALEAGGDGTLIHTEFEWQDEKNILWLGEWKESPDPIEKDLDFIDGTVRWHENEVTFSRVMVIRNHVKTLKGKVHYQTCSEASCFPPRDYSFTLKF